MMKTKHFWLAAIAVILCSCNSGKVSVHINNELNDETIIYALSRFENLAADGMIKILSDDADFRILTEISDHLNTEAFEIETTGKDVTVTGGDATGGHVWIAAYTGTAGNG